MSVGAKEIGWRTGGSKGKIGGVALGDNAPVRHDVGVGAVEDLAVVRADELADANINQHSTVLTPVQEKPPTLQPGS